MKLNFSLFLLLVSIFVFSQNKVFSKSTNSVQFKGSISSSPITIFLKNQEIIDCDDYDRFVEGWYYYDKYKMKIPLNGYTKGCEMKLFNFGKDQKSVSSKLQKTVSNSTIGADYLSANPEEILSFDRCFYSEKKVKSFKGEFKNADKTAEIILDTDDIFVGKKSEYFKLPNQKEINLRKEFAGYGGNQFYSLTEDKTENRLIFYFESISNHNACGQCGASEGEKGFRIIYFDKNWSIKKKDEFSTESCLSFIGETKIVKKSKTEIKYQITESYGADKKQYFLIVNKANSTIVKL